MLAGYRTYFVAGAMALTTLAYGLNFISKEQWEMIMGFLVGAGATTLRMGMYQDAAQVEARVTKEVNAIQADVAAVKVEVLKTQ